MHMCDAISRSIEIILSLADDGDKQSFGTARVHLAKFKRTAAGGTSKSKKKKADKSAAELNAMIKMRAKRTEKAFKQMVPDGEMRYRIMMNIMSMERISPMEYNEALTRVVRYTQMREYATEYKILSNGGTYLPDKCELSQMTLLYMARI